MSERIIYECDYCGNEIGGCILVPAPKCHVPQVDGNLSGLLKVTYKGKVLDVCNPCLLGFVKELSKDSP